MEIVTRKVPTIRFSAFEEEWFSKNLIDISKIERGRFSPRPRNNPIYYGGEIPFVQTSDVVNSKGRVHEFSQTLNEKGLKVSKKFKKGTILITIAANIGYAGVLEIDMACPDSLVGISCKEGVYNYFLNYLLEISQSKMDYLAIEAAQKNINIEFLKIYKFTLPTLPEQQKIASFLTAVDNKINQISKKKNLLEQYKKGVMQKIFSQEIRFKDENGKEFLEWEVKKLGEVFERVTSKNIENNTNVLTISAQYGLINQKEFFNKSVAAQDLTGYYLLEKEDFAYNKSYSKGYPMGAIKKLNRYENGIVSTLYICFRIKVGSAPNFFDKYFNGGFLNRELQKIAQEGARNHGLLNMSVIEFFNDIEIPCPCFSEQQKIANFLTSLDNKINHINTQLEKTKVFKKGLLQQMFV